MPEHYKTTTIAHQRPELRKPSMLDHHNGKAQRAFDTHRRDFVTKGNAKDGYSRKGDAEQERTKRRESFMVTRSQPLPQLRPRGPLAQAVDAEAFDAAWKSEQKAARKAQFKAQRRPQDQSQTRGKDKLHD